MTHLDTDVLAEFRAGLITGRRGAKIGAHLAGCDRCTALDDQLAGVSALLASVPAPAMPDSVARRLDAALAAEVAAETARKNDPERARREPSPEPAASPPRPGHRGFRLMSLRVLAPVAAGVVVLAGGGYGLSLLTSGGGQTVASSSEGSAAARASGVSRAANGAIGAAPVPAASSQAPTTIKGPARSLHPANFPFVASSQNLSPVPATLRQQVADALRAAPSASTGRAAPTQVLACVQRLAGHDPVLLAENARFEGQPATLVVARVGQAKKAWVAGPGCARVLATTSLLPGISGP